MAIVTTIRTLLDSPRQTVVHVTSIIDATPAQETAKILVVKANVVPQQDGSAPASLDIEAVRWCIQGMTYALISWDHTTDDNALVLTGAGFDDTFSRTPDRAKEPLLADPRSAGGLGDILFTTIGGIANGSCDLTLWLRKSS